MQVEFTRYALVGNRCYAPGDRAELPDEVARRHIKAGSAALPGPDVETADAPAAPESADASPGKRRKVS